MPKIETPPENVLSPRDYRIDLLKAIAIVMVMLWHLQPFELYYNPDNQTATNAFTFIMTKILLNGLSLQLTLLGIPIFFIVTLFLFMGKADRPGYFKKRIARLTTIFIFWSAVQFMVYLVLRGMVHLDILSLTFKELSPMDLIIFGGPSLPIVGDSVFYYLFDLICLTALAYVYLLLNEKLRVIVSWLVVVGSIVYFEFCLFLGKSIPYWDVSNFILYIPVAYSLRNFQKLFEFKYYYLLGFIVFSSQDLLFVTTQWGALYDVSVNTYGRASLLFGAVTIFSFVWTSSCNRSRCVQFLSFNVLGIFALHKYWQLFYSLVLPNVFSFFNISELFSVSHYNYSVLSLVSCIVTIISTLILVYALGLTPLKKFIS